MSNRRLQPIRKFFAGGLFSRSAKSDPRWFCFAGRMNSTDYLWLVVPQPIIREPAAAYGSATRCTGPIDCMNWTAQILERLVAQLPCGYHAGGPAASEPTAFAGLALAAHGRGAVAERAADWLAQIQRLDGSVGVTESDTRPKWPTSLAILTWLAAGSGFQRNIESAVRWALAAKGSTGPRKPHIGHDTTLVGWSWAENTHSWLEPTALFVLALKRAGQIQHDRCREAVRLLIDRLLPQGGANYGNTIVLGQQLLAHVQPTGLAMLALAGETTSDPRIEKSLQYLGRELGPDTPTASLAFGVLGLAAHNRQPTGAVNWLESAYQREMHREPSPYKLALLALAAAKTNPMLTDMPT